MISLILLVILPSWGFTLSLLSPIGNIVFTPIFTVLLLFSSLIFFSEILYIPNSWFIYPFEKITSIWMWLIPDFNNKFLIGFAKPPIWFIIAVPIATFAILSNKKINSIKKSILFLAALFIISCAYLKIIHSPSILIKHIPCHNGEVLLIRKNNTNVLIDPGFIGTRISAPSWVEYTLIPEIIKLSGCNCIDHLIVMRPGKITFDAIEKIIGSMRVKNLHLVCFFGKMKKSTARSFFQMKREAEKRNVTINRIGFSKNSIYFANNAKIIIDPLEKQIKYNNTKYPALCATCKIDNENLKIYSAKYKRS